jgi:flagellar P-ring protein precursor FlgI
MRTLLTILIIATFSINAHAVVKIRDIAKVEGIQENQLVGYGVIVGLNGTGDKDQTRFTVQTLARMLDEMGITIDQDTIKVKNVAAVTVTATLPAYARVGQTIDVTVSAMGDAKSLEGGTLIMTPLNAANKAIYAVAQGPISVGGLNASAGGSSVTKNHPTVARIPNGGLVVQDAIPEGMEVNDSFVNLYFDDSLGNVINAKTAINGYLGGDLARVASPSTLMVFLPPEFRGQYYEFLNTVLNIEIQPEAIAKVVVNERTGTIVIGSDVRISTVAVAHGNLTITVTNHIEVSQPLPFTEGQTVVTEEPEIEVAEDEAKLMVVPEGVTVSDLVKALNSIGASPRDLVSILQAIKSAGALHAGLELI